MYTPVVDVVFPLFRHNGTHWAAVLRQYFAQHLSINRSKLLVNRIKRVWRQFYEYWVVVQTVFNGYLPKNRRIFVAAKDQEHIHGTILTDRRLTVREIANDCEFGIDSTHSIITEDSGSHIAAAKCMPNSLSDEWKPLGLGGQ